MRERDKHFLLALLSATGIILFWRGIWEGVGALPLLESPWVSLFVGALILTMSGILFSEFDPLGGIERSTMKVLHMMRNHPDRHEFSIKYLDNARKKVTELSAKSMRHIERNNIIFHQKGREVFIPVHRIRSVHRKGKVIWKL